MVSRKWLSHVLYVKWPRSAFQLLTGVRNILVDPFYKSVRTEGKASNPGHFISQSALPTHENNIEIVYSLAYISSDSLTAEVHAVKEYVNTEAKSSVSVKTIYLFKMYWYFI